MNKLLKFFLVLVGTAAVLGAFIFGTNWNAFQTVFSNSPDLREGREWVHKTFSLGGLVEFVREQPDYVSLVTIPLDNMDARLELNADVSRPMASLSNLLIAVAYAEQIDRGMLDPKQAVSMKELKNYFVPRVYASQHTNVMNWLKKNQKISNDSVELQDLVQALIRFNDFATHDYLYDLIGRVFFEQLIQRLNLSHTETPVPYLGMHLAWNPAIWSTEFNPRAEYLSSLDRKYLFSLYELLSEQWLSEVGFRTKSISVFQENELGMLFSEERELHALMPQSTARDLATLALEVYRPSLLSPEAAQRVQLLLAWPMENRPIAHQFETYGGVFESRIAIQSGIDHGINKEDGKAFIHVIQFDGLPIGFWLHMSSNFINLDFQRRLMWDTELQFRLKRALSELNVTS